MRLIFERLYLDFNLFGFCLKLSLKNFNFLKRILVEKRIKFALFSFNSLKENIFRNISKPPNIIRYMFYYTDYENKKASFFLCDIFISNS